MESDTFRSHFSDFLSALGHNFFIVCFRAIKMEYCVCSGMPKMSSCVHSVFNCCTALRNPVAVEIWLSWKQQDMLATQ